MGLPPNHSILYMPLLKEPYAYCATSTGEVDSMLQKLLIGISNSLKLPPLCNWNSPTDTTVLHPHQTLSFICCNAGWSRVEQRCIAKQSTVVLTTSCEDSLQPNSKLWDLVVMKGRYYRCTCGSIDHATAELFCSLVPILS